MNDMQMLWYVSVGLLTVLVTIIGWLGKHIIEKLDALSEKVSDANAKTNSRISTIDVRVARLETLQNL